MLRCDNAYACLFERGPGLERDPEIAERRSRASRTEKKKCCAPALVVEERFLDARAYTGEEPVEACVTLVESILQTDRQRSVRASSAKHHRAAI